MKLIPVEAFYTKSKKRGEITIYMRDPEDLDDRWILINMEFDEDCTEVKGMDFCDINVLGKFNKALTKVRNANKS